jgi:ABC-type polysaccharide/polyol phosphate transport system ATPase subunit
MNEPAVVVNDVHKKFRLFKEKNHSLKATVMRGRRVVAEDFWALKGVSFEVPKGTTFGLIGENGSGKSTMLKCLTKILRPDSGSVQVNGKVSALLELGAGFHPELSGRENVYLNGAILGLSQKELRKRFDGIVDFAGIGKFIDEPVKNYSSGMYVRLGFSVAINVDPEVLLVDEVLAVGDELFQRKCNEKFAELRNEGKTIVLVSHAMTQVHNLCEEVAWFEHGQIKKIGPAREIVDEYTGNVQMDREADGDIGTRWGSGEGQIVEVELLDSAGRPTTQVRAGDPASFRFHYLMSEPIERPVFGLALHTLDGTHVTGPNSRDVNCVPEKLDGEGYVDVVFDPLRLLPGTYDLTVSLYDYSLMKPYDFRHRVLRFDVERGPIHEAYGVVSLGGRWHVGDLVSEA